ncbi:MAG TPA: PQQ-binding-like beta-propeller repeat protein [Bryobacteraceae bacterium]|nr:PQQ-binding-like beta-propeller repeat protein [Bryobacteraceae bacterium]
MTRLATVLTVLWIAAICSAQSMFRGDKVHSGVSSASGPRTLHGVKWKFATGNRVVSSAVFDAGVVFFGSDDGNVYAVDAATGVQRWKYVTDGPVSSTPAVNGGLVYFLSYDGRFYAVDESSGKLRWKFRTAGERRFEARGLHGMQPASQTFLDPYDIYLSSPVVAAGTVYFGSSDGNVYALDAGSGELRWKFHTGDVVHASPAYANGKVYFGSWDSFFYTVDAATGAEKWRFHGGEDPLIHNQVGFQSSPVIADGIVYTGCRDSNVYAFDAETGKEKWRVFNQGSWVNASPAVVNGTLLYATSDSSLFQAVDVAAGKPVFQQQTKAYVFSSPAVAGNTVYFGVLNGKVEARDLSSGELLWSFQTEASRKNRNWVLAADGSFNSPFLFSSNWNEAPIVAADRQFGIGAIFATPLIVNGVVYVGSADGYVYALD